ncbi:hypothetical protein GCM10017673_53350 [Streptosporangium violaceochromogenes]|nr:hypothetical protein GCM10017673_53350 [Streptosporangium violaceochromogenes]
MPSNVNRLYQVVLRDKTTPISLRLRRAFGEWLVTRGLPEPEPGGRSQTFETDGARLRMERGNDCGRYLLEETRQEGMLRTRVTYAERVPGMTGWTVVTVEEVGEAGAAQAPGFVQGYLRTARVTDGAVHLTDSADEVDEDGVHRLITVLSERHRRVPVIVVSLDPQEPRAARERADHLAAAVAGAAVIVRFADLRAQKRFNETIGDNLGVFNGGIRTYVAPFVPGAESHPYRHRPMGGSTIQRQGTKALDLAAGGAVAETTRRPLPDDVQRTYRVVSMLLAGKAGPGDIAKAVPPRPVPADQGREGLRRWMMAKTARPAPEPAVPQPALTPMPEPAETSAAPPPAPAPAEPSPPDFGELARTVARTVINELRGELDTVLDLATSATGNSLESDEILRQMRTLGTHVDGLREIVVARRAGDRLFTGTEAGAGSGGWSRGEGDRLADEIERLRTEHEILQQEYAEAVAGARKLEERVRWLKARLAEAGQPAFGLTAQDSPFEPTSVVDALNMARETLRHLEIGDTDAEAAKLDLTYPTLARAWASKTWDALRALDAFAQARSAREFSGGFFEWCRDAVGLTIPAGMVAMSESRTVNTNGKYSTRRTFPVPPEVNPSGKVMMEAHIKIRKGGCPAPRIHFHDDSGGSTGKIWIGHVGDHLPNTHTN